MRTRTLLLALMLIPGVACDDKDDQFADAPAVAAPSSAAVTGTPKQGDELPPSHPPLGNVGQSPSTPNPGMAVKPPSGGERVTFASPSEYGTSGPLRWEAPKEWKAAKPATNFRIAEYSVPGADGPANLGIFHFPGGGGGIAANIDRWVGQFKAADGSAAGSTAKRDTLTVDGMTVFRVDVAGTYNPGMAGGGVPQDDYRMRAVIVETSAGPFFFKLVGPKGTVDGQVDSFDTFVKSFKTGE